MPFKKKSTTKRTSKRTTTRTTRSTSKPKVIKLGKEKITIKHPWATKAECKKMGYSSGCDPRCLSKLEKRWGVWAKRAALAKWLCHMKKK